MCSMCLFPICIFEYVPTLETHYVDVVCHPIISIPAPHHEVQYREVKPQDETSVSDCSK